jgi:M6 family metalloprotease-like protein
MYRRLFITIALSVAALPPSVSAQDVEMLGRRYGTTPPAAYYRELARNPDAYRFRHGRAARMREAATSRAAARATRSAPGSSAGGNGPAAANGPAGAGSGGPALVGLGPRDEAVVGDVYMPVVLGLFSDSPPTPPVPRAWIQDDYFGPKVGTVSAYYAEVSNDSITLHGDVQDWVRSTMTQAATAQGVGALQCCGIGNYIKSLLDQLPSVDWGAYDNDGPDGIPNSGDDDGYVDALAVIHPTPGAECNSDLSRVWSHKWTLTDASSGGAYVTGTVANAPDVSFIRVDDYFVQGALKCSGSGLNEIGVFTHETGHAFGLPDLYDTRTFGTPHDGAGDWELMASGTWGCSSISGPDFPCHMGAWSKAMLGWVSVDTLAPDTDLGTLTLPPVETSGMVYRVDAADGSGEYFLLENRQSDVGVYFDQSLPAEGLLIWQIDQERIDATWSSNLVNASNDMGVWLRQADGLDELAFPGGDQGDAGDPFPGSTGNTAFHATSDPAATSDLGTATGLTVIDITAVGDDIDLRVLTRFSAIGLTSSGTGPGGVAFTVNGAEVTESPTDAATAAPFELLTIAAAAGDSVAPGVRTSFDAWDDDPGEPRTRLLVTPLADTAFSASYAGTEYELRVDMSGGVNDVDPGVLTPTPPSSDLWFVPSTAVTLTASAQTGFNFLGWTGDLAGQPNPASVVMDAPVLAGADFELTFNVPDTVVDLVASVPVNLQLEVENGSSPVAWVVESGTAPLGVVLGADGSITGVPLDLGAFPLVFRATDALGLVGTATVTLDVAAPAIPIAELGNDFLLGSQPLDSLEVALLDRQGNQNGSYDLGDFRAWVLANPSLPLSARLTPAAAAAPQEPGVITLPITLEEQEER